MVATVRQFLLQVDQVVQPGMPEQQVGRRRHRAVGKGQAHHLRVAVAAEQRECARFVVVGQGASAGQAEAFGEVVRRGRAGRAGHPDLHRFHPAGFGGPEKNGQFPKGQRVENEHRLAGRIRGGPGLEVVGGGLGLQGKGFQEFPGGFGQQPVRNDCCVVQGDR